MAAVAQAIELPIQAACRERYPGANVICNGSTNFLWTELFFEPEVPFVSLKKSPPTWNEIEQLMDNPYATAVGAACNDTAGAIPGNDQGYPTYCTNASFIRRPAFDVTLPPMLVHPLNYNPGVGAEMRLINPHYTGTPIPGAVGATCGGPAQPVCNFRNTNVCYGTATETCIPPESFIAVSSGASRMVPGETAIDYDVAIGRRNRFCQNNPEPVPLALPANPFSTLGDIFVCGSDPGEPGATAFTNVQGPDNNGLPTNATANTAYYSTPAVPGALQRSTLLLGGLRLVDPDPTRGVIGARDIATGAGGLQKPSLRVPSAGGNGTAPNYLVNRTDVGPVFADPAALTLSNENDYVGLLAPGTLAQQKQAARFEAMRLGKALFWDMQVGSDAVQSCGSCHAHAGADNRTKNQINPNHVGGDMDFTFPPNHDLRASDFPFRKLRDPEIAADPLCTSPVSANVVGIGFDDNTPPDHPLQNPRPVVCDASNLLSDTNDVASSMGVHWGRFFDIPAPGPSAFALASSGVQSVLPDLRSPTNAQCTSAGRPAPCCTGAGAGTCTGEIDNTDPIEGFAGAGGPTGRNEFRRVEPRNTPTIFLADVNFDNFWDGRARHDFNGGSVFGPSDPQSHVFVNNTGTLTPTRQLIKFSSLASLATGPGLSEFEMSFIGRNWAKIGKKLLQVGVTPLANQLVHPADSILGPYSNQNGSACAGLMNADRSPAGPAGHIVTTLGVGVPGLCISYPALIRRAFYAALWNNTSQRLLGCYTDGRSDIHPNQCGTGTYGSASVSVLDGDGVVRSHPNDPFDGYVLTPAAGGCTSAACLSDTNQFNQMEGNFSLFWGLSIHLWATILVPDDTPWDKWLDANPDGYYGTGESGEPLLVLDAPNCNNVPAGYVRDALHGACFREVGNFKRDPYDPNDIVGRPGAPVQNDSVGHPRMQACIAAGLNVNGVERACTQRVAAGGTRAATDPDPLLGMDIFFGSNVSLKNPAYRSARCGECHAAPSLTDHTTSFTHKVVLLDLLPEFERGRPTVEPLMEPLGRPRIISGFLLESEINGPGQDAIERRVINQSIVPAPVVANNPNCRTGNCSGYAFPDGIVNDGGFLKVNSDIKNGPFGAGTPVPYTSFGGALFDNGVYNIGVRPCYADQARVIPGLIPLLASTSKTNCEDDGRGNNDAFGWPLSLTALLMKNLGGTAQQPGQLIAAFDPNASPECAPYCATGGLFNETAHDQQINPGSDDDQVHPFLPRYLDPFANKITVGDAHPALDEAGGPVGGMVNTLTDAANAEGFPEIPFDPRPEMTEVINSAVAPGDGTIGGPGEAMQGTWPMVNRVGRFGSFKAPQLREVELTGPYFHNGGKLTLRQVVDFYTRGGDFPITNSAHRDFNILNLNAELQSNISEEEKVALVDFLLELTDDRVALEKAPFDHPQVILPLDGRSPENTGGRDGTFHVATCTSTPTSARLGPGQLECAGGMFLDVPAVGATGNPGGRLPSFLGLARSPRLKGTAANCDVLNNHYCH
jgi:cytochrome c peroxidase